MKAIASRGVVEARLQPAEPRARVPPDPGRPGEEPVAASALPQRSGSWRIHVVELLAACASPQGQSSVFSSFTSAPTSSSACGAFRVGRREEHRHRPAFGDADQRRALRAGGVHHGPHVVHPLLERADPRALGEAHAALVEQDQPRERRQLLAEAPVAGVLPEQPRWVTAPATQIMSGGPSPSTW